MVFRLVERWDQDEKQKTEWILTIARRSRARLKLGIEDRKIGIKIVEGTIILWKAARGMVPEDIEMIDERIAFCQMKIGHEKAMIEQAQVLLDEVEFILKEFDERDSKHGNNL